VPRAILFDLDDTLVVEDPAAVRTRARELWRAAPTFDYCRRIGISSSEGLWCRFEGDGPETRWLREWSPAYRREAWRLALADQGIGDAGLAEQLGERFGVERRGRHEVFDDVVDALTTLGESHTLGLVTNGASCLQREKLAASGLGAHFAAVVVSAEFGAGKPEPAIFRHALSELGCSSGVMVGDSVERDIDGALAAGLGAVWLNRSGEPRPARQLREISPLSARERAKPG
jgi:putative hydrolase of the HAD superfamily